MTAPSACRHSLACLRGLFVIALVAILYAGLRPSPVPDFFVHDEDKLHHVVGFFALTVLTALAFPNQHRMRQAVALLLLGFGIEAAQAAMPARTFSVYDLAANGVGVVLAIATIWGFNRMRGGQARVLTRFSSGADRRDDDSNCAATECKADGTDQ